jgi:hypothetical protein
MKDILLPLLLSRMEEQGAIDKILISNCLIGGKAAGWQLVLRNER